MYICHKTETTWHWCRNCPDYPKGNYVINRATPPPKEELCPKCAEMAKAGRCEE